MRHQLFLGCSTLAALVSDDHCVALVSRVRKRRVTRLDGGISSLSSVSSSSSFTNDTDDDDVSVASRMQVIGQRKRRLEKSTRREDRIHQLETSSSSLSTNNGVPWKRSKAEDAELAGLLRLRNIDDDANFVEQYDSSSFDDGHVQFKRKHNEAFVALARYCHRQRNNEKNREGFDVDDDAENE
jgi:hypothetical protein